MLEHKTSSYARPNRVVLLGGSGFVGKKLAAQLAASDIDVLAIASSDIDLCDEAGADKLAALLQPQDSLVILSALTPDRGRGIPTLNRNLKMVETVCQALATVSVAHVVYISSDAVYPLTINPVNEQSYAAPTDLYGVMHLTRELMLKECCSEQLCILRPTLIFGAEDSHNSYGPNRFRRQAASDGKINIGGEGEETRDHIYIDDVTRLMEQVLAYGSTGVLNLATGNSIDFGSLAKQVAELAGNDVEVCPSVRNMPVTYRSFDVTAIYKAFPGFSFTPLSEGLAAVKEQTKE